MGAEVEGTARASVAGQDAGSVAADGEANVHVTGQVPPPPRGAPQDEETSVEDSPDCFDIYETPEGLRSVGSPVRRCILAKMRDSELTVPEMIDATGLTKSTISTHLALLYKERLVGYREDPADRRRKRYYLTARYLGMSCPSEPRAGRAVAQMTQDALGDPGGLPKAMLRAFVGEMRASGLDLRPLLRDAGRRVGESVGTAHPAAGLEDWAAIAGAYWQENRLGRLRLAEAEGPALLVSECRLCCSGPDSPRMCGVAAGILEGMASEALRTAVRLQPLPHDEAEAAHARAPAGEADEAPAKCRCGFRLHVVDPEA